MARAISPERWKTYQIAAGFNEATAHKLYLWNAAVGQSFHFPLQTVEVALRNVIHQALVAIYGANWTSSPACRSSLLPDKVNDITKAETRHYRIYAAAASTPQIVASLSLGFWVSLLRRHYNRSIWATQTATAFPHLKATETIVDVSRTATTIQDLRNRIFHQEPLIGQDLSREYAAVLRMLGWICPEMREWVRKLSSVPRVIRERPR
ncbi:MAG: Abi family protein [Sphingomonadales bacterium]|nr:Abi family protein [Sphingomonadales bacterium]